MGRRNDFRDPLQIYIDKRTKETGYTNEDAGREWLGIKGEAFRYRRNRNSFTVPELRRLFRETHASPEDVLNIFKMGG